MDPTTPPSTPPSTPRPLKTVAARSKEDRKRDTENSEIYDLIAAGDTSGFGSVTGRAVQFPVLSSVENMHRENSSSQSVLSATDVHGHHWVVKIHPGHVNVPYGKMKPLYEGVDDSGYVKQRRPLSVRINNNDVSVEFFVNTKFVWLVYDKIRAEAAPFAPLVYDLPKISAVLPLDICRGVIRQITGLVLQLEGSKPVPIEEVVDTNPANFYVRRGHGGQIEAIIVTDLGLDN